jgi:NADH-quinone oxidoreductase subunit G
MVNLTIDGEKVSVPENTTIMDAAEKVNIRIPRLCYLQGLVPHGACGVCVVEVEGERTITRSCVRLVQEGMIVHTNTAALRNTREMLVELLLSNHPAECFICERGETCELKDLASTLGVKEIRFDTKKPNFALDESSPSIVRNPNKCILCGRCIRVCGGVQTVEAIDFVNRGDTLMVAPSLDQGLGESTCINCGQCIHVCPVAAITEKSCINEVWDAIDNKEKHVVVQEAPAVRVALGEELGLPPGTLVAGKMHAALKKLGFDTVFDTNFAADLTIMEEGTELVERVKNGGVLPMITSCCPGWVKFMEEFYPDLMPNLSTCKSPQQMFGALTKTYFAKAANLDPKNIVSVSVMPCTAKKFEAQRPEMCSSGYRDVDYVLTTREIARMIREAGIDFADLPDMPAESLMGAYSGAATIFGASGGVMEAALRTAYKLITSKELESLDVTPVRGMTGVKTGTVPVGELKVNVAVAHGLGNARPILDEIRAGKSPYHFIEIMACPGGCVGGGGQPIGFDMALRSLRGEALYKEDKSLPVRRSHQNPSIIKIYKDYLEKPLGEKSHHLLHTTYISRDNVPDLKDVIKNLAPVERKTK